MARTKTLTEDQVTALLAFLDAFDQTTTGAWSAIEEHMRESWGIEDPETALEAAREGLQHTY